MTHAFKTFQKAEPVLTLITANQGTAEILIRASSVL